MIQIRGLKKCYGEHLVLDGVNLEVKAGEIYGFLGHNGAGKSTTMNILTGLMRSDQGSCHIDGKRVQAGQSGQVLSLGFLPEEPKFYLFMTGREYLNMMGTLSSMKRAVLNNRINELIALVQLESAANQAIGQYSRGMKQRLGLAVALLNDPKLLILDEPSSALDPIGRKDVLEILEKLKANGKTLLLSTHILNDVERVCDRIGILHDGRIVLEGSLEKILENTDDAVIEVAFYDEVPNSFISTIEASEVLVNEGVNNNVVRIKCLNKTSAPQTLMELTMPFAASVSGFNRQKQRLEDVFMKVVKSRE